MDASSCKSIQEYRKCGNQCFAFSRRHFGYFPFMKGYPTDQLDIVVDHVPGYLIAPGNPFIAPYCLITLNSYAFPGCREIPVVLQCRDLKKFVLLESSGSLLHYGKSPWQKGIESFLYLFFNNFLQLVSLVVILFLLVNILLILSLVPERLYFTFICFKRFRQFLFKVEGAFPELIIGYISQLVIFLKHLAHVRRDLLDIPFIFVSEEKTEHFIDKIHLYIVLTGPENNPVKLLIFIKLVKNPAF